MPEAVTPEQFHAALERDRVADASIADWRYLRRSRTSRDQELIFGYHGPSDLLHWIADRMVDVDKPPAEGPRPRGYWARPSYLPGYEELLARSAEAHEQLLVHAGEYDHELYHHRFQDVYNVQDFHYCTALATGVRTVLDYGAGYARQSFLFAGALPDGRYIAVDAVEQSYLLQSWVLRELGLLRWEYLDQTDGNGASLASALEAGPGGFHVPSWRLDLVSDGAVDLVLFVWSLYEMSGDAAQAAVEACRRLVRVGGYVYLRDMPHKVSYRFDPERLLNEHGFELILRPRAIGPEEIHGQQRLYRRTAERRRGRIARRAGRVREAGAAAKQRLRA